MKIKHQVNGSTTYAANLHRIEGTNEHRLCIVKWPCSLTGTEHSNDEDHISEADAVEFCTLYGIPLYID